MQHHTIDKMGDHELVAIVLGLKLDDEASVRLASVVASEGWLSGLPLAEVARECGSVGPKRLQRLEASVELGRRALAARAARKAMTISQPEDVVALMEPIVIGLDKEHFYALALNTKNQLLKVIEVSVGSLNASIVHPRELYRQAISVSAASVIVCHNHPSGDPTPSGADIQLTRRLVKAGDVVGIECLDHIVIGHEAHSSLRDLGLM